jgi:hypothetical protein
MHPSVKHFATPDFWRSYRQLPEEIQKLADKNFELLKRDPRHGSLRFKKVGAYWSARVGLRYRAMSQGRICYAGWLLGNLRKQDPCGLAAVI